MIFIYDDENKKRLDVYLSEQIQELTRSQIKRQIEEGECTVNGKKTKCGQILKVGDKINIELMELKMEDVVPEEIPLDIVFENENFAIINKPAGMVVHPASGNYTGTLVNGLLYHFQNISNIGGIIRPGIVHRIDKDTTGLLVVAKNNKAHVNLAEQIATKTCKRFYYALLEGNVKDDDFWINKPIGRSESDRKKMCVQEDGKPAQTHFKVLERFGDYTLVECELKTGRTHQIRVHSKYINHPVVGDKTYGYAKQKFKLNSQLLHAHKLILKEPELDIEMCFEAKLPEEFEKVLKTLRKKKSGKNVDDC